MTDPTWSPRDAVRVRPHGMLRAPPPSSPTASKAMQGNRPRDTEPELAVRAAVHRRGLRYRVDDQPLPGLRRRADLVFRPRPSSPPGLGANHIDVIQISRGIRHKALLPRARQARHRRAPSLGSWPTDGSARRHVLRYSPSRRSRGPHADQRRTGASGGASEEAKSPATARDFA